MLFCRQHLRIHPVQAIAENDIRTEGLIALKEVLHNNEFITSLDLSGWYNDENALRHRARQDQNICVPFLSVSKDRALSLVLDIVHGNYVRVVTNKI